MFRLLALLALTAALSTKTTSCRVQVTGDVEGTRRAISAGLDRHDAVGCRDLQLVLELGVGAMNPRLILPYVKAMEPLRERTRRVCSRVALVVPNPALRGAVRAALTLFKPDLPTTVVAPGAANAL